MLISIIIPCYNSENTIKKCLNSIINQTYKNIEIICINDGSVDNTLNILRKYQSKDSRIKIINNTNNGVSYSRNCGLEIAKGDYVTFIDSDDFIDLNAIINIVDILKNNSIDVLRYNFVVKNSKNFYNNNLYDFADCLIDVEENRNILYKKMFTINNIPTLCWLLFIKKDIAKKVRFDTNISFLEDTIFYYNLFNLIKNIYFLDKKYYNYIIYKKSLTRNVDRVSKNIENILYVNDLFRKDKKIEKELIVDINTNHLNMIARMLPTVYSYDKRKYKDIYRNISKQEAFINILKYNDLNQIEFKKRIYIFSLKYHLFLLTKLILIFSSFYIKNKNEV